MRSIPILTYHSIDSSGSPISVTEEALNAHLRYLTENDFKVISINEVIRLLKQYESPVEQKVIALTFDDGYENFYSKAVPLLLKHQMTATIFLISDYCGKNAKPPGMKNIPQSPFMTWDQIRELPKLGIDLGAHSCTHPNLTKLTLTEAKAEILNSRDLIQQQTGSPVQYFAYPFGISNKEILEIVTSNFRAAVGTFLSLAGSTDNIHNLSRIDAYYVARRFGLLNHPALSPYLFIRNLGRQIRSKFVAQPE